MRSGRGKAGCRRLLMGMIAGADQRAGLYVAETYLQRFRLKSGKLARGVEARHGQVVARGAQVLADGEDVAARGGQISLE
jgi:hypothetical protein